MRKVGDTIMSCNFVGRYNTGIVISVKKSWSSNNRYLIKLAGGEIVSRDEEQIWDYKEDL